MIYDPDDNSRKCFDLAISSLRERLEKSRVVIGDAVLYNEDCSFILPTLHGIDAVVSDPPYGMSWNTNSSRFSGGHRDSVARRGQGRDDWGAVEGDDQPFDPEPWMKFPKVILWGSNHFHERLPKGTTLVWVKRLDGAFGSFLSDAEVAWMKGGHGVYCWRDISLYGEAKSRAHPTQKPIGLMKWCIERLTADANTILDPYMGSGTTGIAAVQLGRKFIGIEKDPTHFGTACRRIQDAYAQPDLFVAPPEKKPEQMNLV